MKRYRIVISEEEVPECNGKQRRFFRPMVRERDIFQAIFDAPEIDINRVRRVIVEGPGSVDRSETLKKL